MSVLIWILSIVLVALCGVVVFLILGQDVKGGGLAGALGGGSVQSAFGSRTTETVLKLTAYIIASIFILVVILVKLYAKEFQGYETTVFPPEPPASSGPATPVTPPAGQ